MTETSAADGAAPDQADGDAGVGYFGSRLRPNERTIGLVLVVAAAAIAVGGWVPDYIDTRQSHSLALAAAGFGLSVLFWQAVRNGRRVVAAFAAILPPLIPPAYKPLAYAQFIFFAYAAWLMIKASNEASRSAAARRQRNPRPARMTPAERAAARKSGKQPVVSATGRPMPKPNKRYTPPAPKKKRPPASPPPAEAKATTRGRRLRGAPKDVEVDDDL